MARGTKWPNQKRIRYLKRINHLLPKKGWKLTFEQVADETDVPERTLIHWHQAEKRQLKQEAQEKEAQKTGMVGGRGSEVAGTGEDPESLHFEDPPAAPPPPAELQTENGLLRCSRCKGKQIEERESNDFYCQICQVVLLFSGFTDEGPMKRYIADPRYEWMR